MLNVTLHRLAGLCGVLLCFAMPARAADSCEATFRAQLDATRGSRFEASRALPGLRMRAVLSQLQTIARQEGFEIASTDYSAGYGDLTFRQKSTANARGFTLVARASESEGRVGITTQMPTGMRTQPDDVRRILCGMLAKISAPASPRADTRTASTATRASARGERPKGELPVGECPPGGCKITWDPAFTSDIHAPREDNAPPQPPRPRDDRTAPPSPEDRLRPVSPRTAFNLAEARSALQEGNAVISGTACVARGGNIYPASNEPIYLYPATRYMEELVQVMRRAKPGRDRVVIADGVLSARLEGVTNNEGGFRFARLKPGKYYLYATMATRTLESREVVVGSYVTYGGQRGDVTGRESFTVDHDDVLEKFVEVGEGQAVQVTLSPRFSLRSGHAGVFGCN